MEESQTYQKPKSQKQLEEPQSVATSGGHDEKDHLTIPAVLPVLPLADMVIYPFTVQPLVVVEEHFIRLINDIMNGDRLVVLVAQKSAEIEQARPSNIFKIGTLAQIGRMVRMLDGSIQILVQGLERVEIGAFTQEQPYLVAHVTLKPDIQETDDETEAVKRNVVSSFHRYVSLVQNVPEREVATTLNLEEARQVVYVIASLMQMALALSQKLLELDSVRAKLEHLSSFLTHELEIVEVGKKIQTSAREEMSKTQREYMLREQLKAQYCELKSRNSSASLGKGSGEAIEKVRMCERRNDETNLHVVTV